MEFSTSYFATCTRAETMLLDELAKEHVQQVRVKRIETPHSMQVVIETTSQAMRDYIYFMLNKLRASQRGLESTLALPAANTVDIAVIKSESRIGQ